MTGVAKKINTKNIMECLTPMLLVLAIFLLSLLIKGCFPFGSREIGYIDFVEGYIPCATSLWDFVHGNIDFINWSWGGGANMFPTFVLNGFLCPLNFLICLFPREQIIYALTLLVGLKLVVMALTSYVCFKTLFKNVNKVVLCIFSLCWVFSGWTVVHFTNVGWLDLLIVLPLLILSAKQMIKTENILLFTLLLSYCFILSFYISYMITIAIFVITLFYIIYLAKDRKKVCTLFIISIALSVFISAFVTVPSLLAVLSGNRIVTAKVPTDTSSLSSLFDAFFSKLSVLLMSVVPFVFFVRLLTQIKKDKQHVMFFLMSFIFLTIGVLIEPINVMWHGGSYYSFPFRYSFLIVMLLIFASLYYLNNFDLNLNKSDKKISKQNFVFKTVMAVICFLVLIVTFIFFIELNTSMHPYRPLIFVQFIPYCIIFATSYYIIEYFLSLDNAKLALKKLSSYVLILAFVILQSTMLSLAFVGAQTDLSQYRIYNAQEIPVKSLQSGYKIKDRENVYTSNIALLTNYPTLANWIHLSTKNHLTGLTKLGYNTQLTLMYSSGGTLLTDILLGNKYVLSQEDLDENYYTKITEFSFVKNPDTFSSTVAEKTTKIGLYQLNFEMQPVFTTDVDVSKLLLDIDVNTMNLFDVQNLIYKQLFSQSENVLEEVSFNVTELEDSFVISANAPSGKIAYISSDFNTLEIKDRTGNLLNGINDLGTIKNDKFSVEISKEYSSSKLLTEELIYKHLKLAVFDAAKFKQVYENYQNCASNIEIKRGVLNINVDNTLNKKYAFIPYVYLNSLSAKNNNNLAKTSNGLDAFICVNLNSGENNIEISASNYGGTVGAIISLIGVFLLIVFTFVNTRFNLVNKKWFKSVCAYGWFLAISVIAIIVYLAPTLLFFVNLFS